MDDEQKKKRNKQKAAAERKRYRNLPPEKVAERNAKRRARAARARALRDARKANETLQKSRDEGGINPGAANTSTRDSTRKTSFCSNCESVQDVTVHESGTAFCEECGGEILEESGGREPDACALNSSTVRGSNAPSGHSTPATDSAPASSAPSDCRVRELSHAFAASQKEKVFSKSDLGFDVEPSPILSRHYAVACIKPNSQAERHNVRVGDLLWKVKDRRAATFSHPDDVRNCFSAERRPLSLTFVPKDKVQIFLDLIACIASTRNQCPVPPLTLASSQTREVSSERRADEEDDIESLASDDDCNDTNDLGGGADGLRGLNLSPIPEEREISRSDSFDKSDDENNSTLEEDHAEYTRLGPTASTSVRFAESTDKGRENYCGRDDDSEDDLSPREDAEASITGVGYSQADISFSLFSHNGDDELNTTEANQSFLEPAAYPFSVDIPYLRPLFDQPANTKAWKAAVWEPFYEKRHEDDFNWEDNKLINEAYPKRLPKKQYGQINVPQGILQDLVDPDSDDCTEKNRLLILNFWRSSSPEFQRKLLAYLKEKIYKKPTVDNTPLPGSSYEQEVMRRRGGKVSHRAIIASTADDESLLEELLRESYCGAKNKKSTKRRVGEAARTTAQLNDGTARRLEEVAEKAVNKLVESYRADPDANIKGEKGIAVLRWGNVNEPLLRGGRHLRGVGEKNRERRKGVHMNIQTSDEDAARKILGKRRIEQLSSGNNVLTFNNQACAELSERRKRPRMADAKKTIEGAETMSSAGNAEGGPKLYHGGIG